MSAPAYLLPAEVAARMGIHRDSIVRMLRDDRLPGLQLGRAWRIEAGALIEGAPDPIPDGASFSAAQLAAHWRVSPAHVRALARTGVLHWSGRSGRIGQTFGRRAVVRFIIDHTRGDCDSAPRLHVLPPSQDEQGSASPLAPCEVRGCRANASQHIAVYRHARGVPDWLDVCARCKHLLREQGFTTPPATPHWLRASAEEVRLVG